MAQPSLSAPLAEIEFLAFDTETTGLTPSQERVIELSGVRFNGAGETDTFEALIDPERPIPEAASRVHGVYDADVVGKPKVSAILPQFMDFAGECILLAHNAEFDVLFLSHEAARHDLRLPPLPAIDSVEIARSLRPDLPNHKLETISRALDCASDTYHRALDDSRTLMRIFQRLTSDGLAADATFGDLLALTSGALRFGQDARLRMWLPPELAPLDEALDRGGKVNILYEPEGKRPETPVIEPIGFMRRPGATWLKAHCDRKERSYRLDWIKRAQYAQATLF